MRRAKLGLIGVMAGVALVCTVALATVEPTTSAAQKI
jgi:hypothetical protein